MSKDADIFDRVMKYVQNKNTAVDVGAHKGVWTEKMALVFDKVYCFEPNGVLYDRLCGWVRNRFVNVEISNSAILDENGTGSLCFPINSRNKSRSFYVVGDEIGDVKIEKLDSLGIEGCGLLKVDVEGGELLVLKGAEKMLREQVGLVVVVEYKPLTSSRFSWTWEDLCEYMEDLNFSFVFGDKPNVVFSK